jgi:hypothetical protein
MISGDICILFLTVNKVPKYWSEFQRKVLMEAAGKIPIITVAKEKQDWGSVNLIQEEPISVSNIYWQMLKVAKTVDTKYVAIAEDDVLYPYEHFHSFRPPLDTFAYNSIRWQVHTWEPTYYWRSKIANYSLIAPRELMIEALEERFKKYPDGIPEEKAGELGRWTVEKRLKVEVRKAIEFRTTIGLVCVHHDFGIDPLERNHRKRMGMLRAFDIPYWGRSEDVIKKFI